MSLLSLLYRLVDEKTEYAEEVTRLLQRAAEDDDYLQALDMDRAHRMRVRDNALVEASSFLSTDESSSWGKAKALEDAVNRFSCDLLPRLSGGLCDALSPSEEALRRAYWSGIKLPKDPYYLNQLLAKMR